MSISQAQIEHIAALSRLSLNQAEKEEFSGQLSNVLAFIDKLNQLDLSDVVPCSHPLDLVDALREDSITQSLDLRDVLSNAPDKDDDEGMFRVPPIFEG